MNLARYGAAVLTFALLPITVLGAAPAVPPPSIDTVAGTTVLQQLDSAASLAGVTLVVRAGLDRQTMKQNGVAALVAETIMKTPVGTPAMPLEDAVAARGGSVRFTVDPGRRSFLRRGAARRRTGRTRALACGNRGAGFLSRDRTGGANRTDARDRCKPASRVASRLGHAQRGLVAAGQRGAAGTRHARLAFGSLSRRCLGILSRVLSSRRRLGKRRRTAGRALARRALRRSPVRCRSEPRRRSPCTWPRCEERRAKSWRIETFPHRG